MPYAPIARRTGHCGISRCRCPSMAANVNAILQALPNAFDAALALELRLWRATSRCFPSLTPANAPACPGVFVLTITRTSWKHC